MAGAGLSVLVMYLYSILPSFSRPNFDTEAKIIAEPLK